MKVFRKCQINPLASQPTFAVYMAKTDTFHSFGVTPDRPFLAASITKLLTAVVVLRLHEQGFFSIDDSLDKYLSDSELSGLLKPGVEDLAGSITLAELLANRSGLANYYQLKTLNPKSDIAKVSQSDPGWDFQEVLALTKRLPSEPHKVRKRASYSFTNFQILSEVIERVTGKNLKAVCESEIFLPGGLKGSKLLNKDELEEFHLASPVLFNNQKYLGAARMASLRGEGALISTSTDLISFLRKLNEGDLVSRDLVERMRSETRPMFPFVRYGLGQMKIEIPGLLIGSTRTPELYGHLGATGSFAFWEKRTDTYLAGTVNQLGNRRLGSKFLFEIVSKVLKSL